MVCRIERRWQGREAGTSQKGIILLREDSLSGAWTQNTKHEKKRHAINTKPKEQNTMLRSTSQWLRQRWQGRVTRKSQEGQGKGTERGKRPGTDTRMRGRSTDYIICRRVGMRSIGSQPCWRSCFFMFLQVILLECQCCALSTLYSRPVSFTTACLMVHSLKTSLHKSSTRCTPDDNKFVGPKSYDTKKRPAEL